ncbi:MAG TPA: hypothetical protein VGK10_01355 [Prolixibacteraceae bacterium]|jgi:hypothetical protein
MPGKLEKAKIDGNSFKYEVADESENQTFFNIHFDMFAIFGWLRWFECG